LEAIILAGGFGTRLRSVVRDLPKPMADVGGKPFISYLVDSLSDSGVKRIIFSVGYGRDAIMNYFGNASGDISFIYAEETQPLGTGGAILNALKFAEDENLLVLNGDSFFDVDLKGLYNAHLASHGPLTISLKPMKNFERYGSVEVSGNRVNGFREKERVDSGLINAGVYVMNRSISKSMEKHSTPFSFESDFLPKKCEELEINAHISDGYFIDIGIPEDYNKARLELPSAFGDIGRKTVKPPQ
jgi:D-glycero-alpha-D-manno-heptose 1-phosphate guanylyltransferase